MSNCCICGKKLGIFNYYPLLSFQTCESCRDKIELLQKGDTETYREFIEIKKTISNREILNYLNDTEKIPDDMVLEVKKIREDEKRHQEAERKRFNEMMLTTGYNFEGYVIKKYIDIVSGECVIGTGFLSEFESSISDITGNKAYGFSTKISKASKPAKLELKTVAFAIGGNAVIGIDFDYIVFQNNMIGVVAKGTSVVVERLE